MIAGRSETLSGHDRSHGLGLSICPAGPIRGDPPVFAHTMSRKATLRETRFPIAHQGTGGSILLQGVKGKGRFGEVRKRPESIP